MQQTQQVHLMLCYYYYYYYYLFLSFSARQHKACKLEIEYIKILLFIILYYILLLLLLLLFQMKSENQICNAVQK